MRHLSLDFSYTPRLYDKKPTQEAEIMLSLIQFLESLHSIRHNRSEHSSTISEARLLPFLVGFVITLAYYWHTRLLGAVIGDLEQHVFNLPVVSFYAIGMVWAMGYLFLQYRKKNTISTCQKIMNQGMKLFSGTFAVAAGGVFALLLLAEIETVTGSMTLDPLSFLQLVVITAYFLALWMFSVALSIWITNSDWRESNIHKNLDRLPTWFRVSFGCFCLLCPGIFSPLLSS